MKSDPVGHLLWWILVPIGGLLLAIIPGMLYLMGKFQNIPMIFFLSTLGWIAVTALGAREVYRLIEFHSGAVIEVDFHRSTAIGEDTVIPAGTKVATAIGAGLTRKEATIKAGEFTSNPVEVRIRR